MAAMAALGRRLRELGRVVGCRGVKTPPGAPSPAEDPSPPPPAVLESTSDFVFVQRLLPPTRVPDPPPHPSYPTPSGWTPPRDPPPALPYYIRRSRLHNLPVYQRVTKGTRRLTELRHVEGDLWALERDLRAFLGGLGASELRVQVNEVTGTLRLGGHWQRELRGWLLEKGF